MLRVHNISFSIRTKKLLDHISFDASPGELTGILGPNGAGKSTLIKLLSLQLKADTGTISWNTRPLSDYSTEEMARQRAVLTQHIHMSHDFPVREVVLMGRYPFFKHRPSPLDWEFVDQRMEQTETDVFSGRAYQSLSGGEKQRVQMARTMTQLSGDNGPFLLLLDEPLNNLDIRHQHLCLEQAKAFAQKGHAVLAVLHDINLAAQFADQILLLKTGKKKAFGSPVEVCTSDLLSDCYEMPVQVSPHPFRSCPMVHFGATENEFSYINS